MGKVQQVSFRGIDRIQVPGFEENALSTKAIHSTLQKKQFVTLQEKI